MTGANHASLHVVPSTRFPGWTPNGYQKSKARAIAAFIIRSAAGTLNPDNMSDAFTLAELPQLVAKFSADNWRTVAFQAGQSIPSDKEKILVVAYLSQCA